MMAATEVMYLLETLRSKKEDAESYDGVKVFTDLMTTLMDSQSDLLLDSLSMSDASSETSWLRLFLDSEASATNRRFMVR
jgi:hypothetical protein